MKTYSGEKMLPLGDIGVDVEYEGQKTRLKLYVVEKRGPALFEREWFNKIQPNRKSVKGLHQVSSNIKRVENLDNILKRYSSIFQVSKVYKGSKHP